VRGYELLEVGRTPVSIEPASTAGQVLVVETLTGATLSSLIETEHPDGMDPGDVAMLGLHLCSILHYLHGRGVLRLDLKPSNIVCEAGTAVVLDLSLAPPPGRCAAGIGMHEHMAP
jgi:serine/threonine protein kinase